MSATRHSPRIDGRCAMTADDRPTPRHAEAMRRGEAAWERMRAERDYSWSANPIHDALLAERSRAELEEWGQ